MFIAADDGRGVHESVHRGRETHSVGDSTRDARWNGHRRARAYASSCEERATPAATTVGAVRQIDANDDAASVAHPLHGGLAGAAPTGGESGLAPTPTGRGRRWQCQDAATPVRIGNEGGDVALSSRDVRRRWRWNGWEGTT